MFANCNIAFIIPISRSALVIAHPFSPPPRHRKDSAIRIAHREKRETFNARARARSINNHCGCGGGAASRNFMRAVDVSRFSEAGFSIKPERSLRKSVLETVFCISPNASPDTQ